MSDLQLEDLTEVAGLLLEARADADSADLHGETPLCIASDNLAWVEERLCGV